MKQTTLPLILILLLSFKTHAQSKRSIFEIVKDIVISVENFNEAQRTETSAPSPSPTGNSNSRSGYGQNLVINGNFESPRLSRGSYRLESSIEGWNKQGLGLIEIQNHAAGEPQSGSQLLELDSDRSSTVTQTLKTDPGKTYILTFHFAARPRSQEEHNVLLVGWNGNRIDSLTKAGSASTNWEKHTYEVVATSSSTTLSFADGGISNSIGTYVDNVSVTSAERTNSTTTQGGIKTTSTSSRTTSNRNTTTWPTSSRTSTSSRTTTTSSNNSTITTAQSSTTTNTNNRSNTGSGGCPGASTTTSQTRPPVITTRTPTNTTEQGDLKSTGSTSSTSQSSTGGSSNEDVGIKSSSKESKQSGLRN